MKKNPTEEKDERLQGENQSKTNIEGAGNNALKIFVFVLIVIAIIAALYFITLQNNNTFKIF